MSTVITFIFAVLLTYGILAATIFIDYLCNKVLYFVESRHKK